MKRVFLVRDTITAAVGVGSGKYLQMTCATIYDTETSVRNSTLFSILLSLPLLS
jgi:hypothetical protein